MKNNQLNIIIGLILLVPFILLVIFWGDIPTKFPVHWNINGEADRFSESKWAILWLPIINVVVAVGTLFVLPRLAAKPNFPLFTKSLQKLVALIATFFSALFLFQLDASLWQNLPSNTVVYLVFLLLAGIGNYLSKVRPNYFIGIRTPWTLESEQVWVKTHRLTGFLWVIASLAMIVVRLTVSNALFWKIMMVYIAFIVLLPFLYSYQLFRKEQATIHQ